MGEVSKGGGRDCCWRYEGISWMSLVILLT